MNVRHEAMDLGNPIFSRIIDYNRPIASIKNAIVNPSSAIAEVAD